MRLEQRHAHDVGAAQRDHDAELLVGDRVDGLQAEPGGEHAVERGRRAAALDVARAPTARASLPVRASMPDASQSPMPDEPHVAERVERLVLGDEVAVRGQRALGHDDDRRVVRLEAGLDPADDLVEVERLLGDEDARSRRRTMPACSAIQPAWRPMTSTTSTRWCDSAVVCSRSIASEAMLTAVSKPNV